MRSGPAPLPHEAQKSAFHVRRFRFALFFAGLIGLVLMALDGCHQRSGATARAKAQPRTTITAFIWAPDWPEEMLEIAAEFTKRNPDISVNVQFMIANSVEENIKPRIASGNMPDLISVNPNAYAAHLADQGILADVGETAAWKNMLVPLKADWTSQHGRHFGISGGVATTLMYYNKDIFAKAGVKALPTNFPEFLAVCEQLKRAGYTPLVWNGGFPNMLGNGPFSSGFGSNVVAHDPKWKEEMAAGTLNLNTAPVADIFAKMLVLPQRGFVQNGYMGTDYDEGIQLFKEGKVAMAFQGNWAAGVLLRGDSFAVGMFIPPWNAAGEPEMPVVGSETGFAVCETANKAASMRFLEFMAGPGFSILQRKRQNIPPFIQPSGAIVSDQRIVDYTNKVRLYPESVSPYYSFLPSNSIEQLHQLMHDVLLKKITPRQAAKLLDQSVKYEVKMHYQ